MNERQALLQSSMGHNAVLGWLSTLFRSAITDGRMAAVSGTGTSTLSMQVALQNKVVELRSTYASIADELTGRMPLAYTQLVQIMVDLLICCTPFALMHSVGGFGAMVGTGLVTLFHSSILNLAKMFLDPFNNDDYGNGAGISINVATLMQACRCLPLNTLAFTSAARPEVSLTKLLAEPIIYRTNLPSSCWRLH